MKCPLCQKPFLSQMNEDCRYYFCSHCHLGRLKKFPRADYSSSYYTASSTLARRAFGPIESFFYKLRTSYAGNGRFNSWMDVGAGDGGYLETVPVKRRLGIEISVSGRRQMEKKGIISLSARQYQRLGGKSVDIISFWHVLEHVELPWVYLKRARLNLKNSGKIIVAVPNIDSLEYRIFGKRWFHLVPQYHLWHFSLLSMTKLLNRAGFRIVSTNFWSLEHHLTGILQTFINATSRTDAVLQKLVKRSDGGKGMNAGAFVWSLVWLTVGSPLIVALWILQVILKRPGTFVVVAVKTSRYEETSQ